MEKTVYAGSNLRIAQTALYGLLSLCFLTSSLLLSLLCLFMVVERCLPYIPGAAFLRLDHVGFTVCYWFRKTRYHWSDIAEFRVITYRYMGIIPFRRIVGFRYTESSGKRHLALRIVGAIARFDRSLPDTYGMKAKELALLLDLWRITSVARGQPSPP